MPPVTKAQEDETNAIRKQFVLPDEEEEEMRGPEYNSSIQTPGSLWSKISPLELSKRAFNRIRTRLTARDRNSARYILYSGIPNSDVNDYMDTDNNDWGQLNPLRWPRVGAESEEGRDLYDQALYHEMVVSPPLKSQAKDLAAGEVAGILRSRDKTKGLVEEGSAFDRAMATGILPGQVGQFLTDDKNIIKGSKGEVKQSLRNIGDKLRAGPGGRRTRRRQARKTRRSRK